MGNVDVMTKIAKLAWKIRNISSFGEVREANQDSWIANINWMPEILRDYQEK